METSSTGLQLLADVLVAFNAHDVPGVLAHCSPDHQGLDVTRGCCIRGHESIGQALRHLLASFPDARLIGHPVAVQSDRMVLYWTITGTHKEVALHIPPTHRQVTFSGLSMLRMDGNRLTHSLHLWDMAGMLRAMQLLPDLPGVAPDVRSTALLAGFFLPFTLNA
jgi:predicted ester cyclase